MNRGEGFGIEAGVAVGSVSPIYSRSVRLQLQQYPSPQHHRDRFPSGSILHGAESNTLSHRNLFLFIAFSVYARQHRWYFSTVQLPLLPFVRLPLFANLRHKVPPGFFGTAKERTLERSIPGTL